MKHAVFNLDNVSIAALEKGQLYGTPLNILQNLHMSDIEKVWGTPHEHHDYEDIQTYVYLIDGQRFIIDEDEMKELYHIQVELDYTKEEILSLLGTPTTNGNIFIYEKKLHEIQFEKIGEHWRLILRKK